MPTYEPPRTDVDRLAFLERAAAVAAGFTAMVNPSAAELAERRIMRTYGARFSYLKGEPADPDDSADAPQP